MLAESHVGTDPGGFGLLPGAIGAGEPADLGQPAAGLPESLVLRAIPQSPSPGRLYVLTTDEIYGTFTDPTFGCPWGLATLSAHVLVQRPADCHQVRRDLEEVLCGRFGLNHSTLQADHAPDELPNISDTAP